MQLHRVLLAVVSSALVSALTFSCASMTQTHSEVSAPSTVRMSASAREDGLLEGSVEPQGPQTPQIPAVPPAAAADPDLAIAMVANEPIDVRAFLARIWMRSSDESREVLERLVVERLALLEAERQEIAVSPTLVDERMEAAWKILGDGLERQGRGVSIARHLQTELGVDTEYYRRQLRREAIGQLLAERVVRTWATSRERCVVRLVELPDQAALDAFTAGQAAGRDFESLAGEFHRFREKEPGGKRLVLIKNANAELSRVAFNTPAGTVAGPLTAEQGRHLMMKVEQLLPAMDGAWKVNAAAIEMTLQEYPVDEFEFVQWRADMVKSYDVDLDPFFRLIGVSR